VDYNDDEDKEIYDEDDKDLEEYDKEQLKEHVYYDPEQNAFIEEIGDENSEFYQKKTIKNGPGF